MWERTPQGDPIGGWGLYLTARDMAKLGFLYLHNGEWDGKQVVSKAWVQASIGNDLIPMGDWAMGIIGGSTRPMALMPPLDVMGRQSS